MNNLQRITALFLCLACAWAQTTPPSSLKGVVTDPSGALVPDALVQLRGPGGEQRVKTNASGEYTFPSLPAGKYLVRVIVKGFSVSQNQNLAVSGAITYGCATDHRGRNAGGQRGGRSR